MTIIPLKSVLEKIEDPRNSQGKRYELVSEEDKELPIAVIATFGTDPRKGRRRERYRPWYRRSQGYCEES